MPSHFRCSLPPARSTFPVGLPRRSLLGLALLLAALSPCAALRAQEWTRFRGPNGTGLSDAEGIPTRWDEKGYLFRVKLPGEGISQPVVWGDKVFVTSAEEEGARRLLLCLSASDGRTLWSRSNASSTHRKHRRNTYASTTPAVDADRVYYLFSSPSSFTVQALDHAGKEAWTRDLGPFQSNHGQGASPVLFEDLVVVANEQDGESFLAALDRRTGEVRWKRPRQTEETAYSTPCLYTEKDGRPALLFASHAHGLSSIDPRSGAVNWEARVFDKRTVSSPIFAGGLALGTCGSGGGGNFLAAVRPGGSGDVTTANLAYRVTRAVPYVPSLVARGDLLFLWADMGVVSCLELATGNQVWQARADGNYSGSPVCVGDRIYCLSEEGEAVVLAAGREFKVLARNPLGEGTRSTPAVAGGRMYLRTYSHLMAVGPAPAAAGASGNP